MDLAPFIVCPETLGPLDAVEGGYWSPRAKRLYPVSVRRDLLFMGYPKRDSAMIAATMEEERVWQGTGEAAASNLRFLRTSAPLAVDLINLTTGFAAHGSEAPRAVELGCGSGWVSWLLAEAGFDTWMCDFEANSLATGINFRHPRLSRGIRRLVTDARYAPFASESVDVVLLKEFVHHVEDYRSLFREANRILREGGIMVFMEPVRSLWRTIYEYRHPDPHDGHHVAWADSYLRAIRRAGFVQVHKTALYPSPASRPVVAWLQDRAAARVKGLRPLDSVFTNVHLRTLGGASLIVIARKARHLRETRRPPMAVIDPASLDISDDELAAYAQFPEVLREAAARLTQL